MKRSVHFVIGGILCLQTVICGEPPVESGTLPRVTSRKEPPAPEKYAHPAGLFSTEMLGKLSVRGDRKVVIIDARGSEEYAKGHIPEARNIQSDLLQDPERPPYFMPASDVLKRKFQNAGISPDSQIVVYDEDDGRLAARIWFTLHACGHDYVAILDGGAGKWRAEERRWTSNEPEKFDPGTFVPSEKLRGVCAFDELAQFRTRVHTIGRLPSTTMIDARSQDEYTGEQVRGKRGGRIPGAVNVQWSGLMSGTDKLRVWRSAPEMHAILRLANVDSDQKICIYDQAGARSAHVYFSLWLMGYEKIFNYSGGWREYGNKEDVEVEK